LAKFGQRCARTRLLHRDPNQFLPNEPIH